MRIVQSIGAVLAPCFLLIGPVAAQDQTLQAQVEELQSQYEQAWTAGDTETLASLFTDDAVLWPVTGGSFEGREAIRGAIEDDPPPQAVDINSNHTERLGELVLDLGSFSVTMPEEQGGTVEGEYLVLAEETEDGLSIRRLVSFEPRRPPQQPQ